jgi:hypothetical protein
MPVEDPGALTGLVPVLQRGGYFSHMPFRGVGPTGRKLDLKPKSSFVDGHLVLYRIIF